MAGYDDDLDYTPTEEWAGWLKEDDTGRIRYSSVHLISDDTDMPVCGAEPRGGVDWLAECDSAGSRCQRCQKAADRKRG